MIDQTAFELIFRNFLASEGASTKTQKNYCADVRDFFNWRNVSGTSGDQVTVTDIEQYVAFLLKEQKTIATINRRLSSLRIFFRILREKQLCAYNPTDGMKNLEEPGKLEKQHKEIVSAWQANLRVDGKQTRAIDQQTRLVVDFLDWVKTQKTS